MADEGQKEQETRVALDDMPLEVRQLADVMLGVNPDWNVHDWLVKQANNAMDLLSVDLLHEKLAIEQRLQRLDDLGRRIEGVTRKEHADDPYQRNLFDCFDINEEHPLRGLGQRAVEPSRAAEPVNLGQEPHPSSVFIDLMPNDNTDDPLLAIACQTVLITVEAELASGEPVATLEAIFKGTRSYNIDDDETDEALDHLLSIGGLIEIDDNCFILFPQ
ncbi:MAG: hypothetical protein HOI79_07015 [Euryarchaeota archaeon]|jgi:hypothetical protein|nr:hypothetical protein [Euryarchaeota archaeon]MBT5661803.1 hypothetical protein [Euryarchaeota archaeon]